ncbi:MAG: hypothetical protein C4B59_03950 [Candidatus Methanogaster sp.]|uniref:Uncharacterized protein n=1 Tax=Candidatus Methanogaster sp. TaxID=3386292 RepID=A0AC61L525_9EURY|nr:MAG: hypothetical protein C4B59_03950 [ANME-2 cluster archaeon]
MVLIKDADCRLQIGDVCCSLRFDDPAYGVYSRKYFNEFISDDEPELILDISINLTENDLEETDIPDSVLLSKTVNGNSFDFHSGLIKGILDMEERRCTVTFSGKGIHSFKQFLFSVYYTLVRHNHPGESNFLIHACAVSRDGCGYVFSGPSESGKSTIARFSSDHTILNDETVIIRKENGSYMVSSTPFRGDYMDNENVSTALNAIFLIRHGEKNIIKEISKKEFVIRFIKEVIYSDSLLSTKRADTFSEMVNFCSMVADEVPFYELQFLPDSSFWNVIDDFNGLKTEKEV